MRIGLRKTAPAPAIEAPKIENALATLEAPRGPLSFVPNPLTVVTGPLKLVMLAGRAMRRNLGVAAVVGGLAVGGLCIGTGAWQSTRPPSTPPAGVDALEAELQSRLTPSPSATEAYWCLNRIEQASERFRVDGLLEDMGPELLALIRAAPPLWSVDPTLADAAEHILASTDDRQLSRDDPAVRFMVDSVFPEVGPAARDIDARLVGHEPTADDARWIIDRLARFGVDVHEVVYRVDASAVATAFDTLDDETLRHHRAFVAPVLESIPADGDVAQRLANVLSPGTAPAIDAVADAASDAERMRALSKARCADDVSFEHVLGALSEAWNMALLARIPPPLVSKYPATIRRMLDELPSDERLAALAPEAAHVVAGLPTDDAEAALSSLAAADAGSARFGWSAIADELGSARLVELVDGAPANTAHRGVLSRLAGDSDEPDVVRAMARHFPREAALAEAIAGDVGTANVADEIETAPDDVVWREVVRQLPPDAVARLVETFPLDRARTSEKFLEALLRSAPEDVVSANDPRAIELRLRIDDIDYTKITDLRRGWIDHGDDGVRFVDGPQIDDLKQGIGTCYLTSVIAGIAHRRPEYLERIVADRATVDDAKRAEIEAGLPPAERVGWRFAVRVFEPVGGLLQERWIAVTPELPVDRLPADGLPPDAKTHAEHYKEHVYSRDRGPNGEVELYAGLIEKACAELERGRIPKHWMSADDWRAGDTSEERYDKLVGGHPEHSMQWLLGTPGHHITFAGRDPDETWDELKRAIDGDVCVARLEGHVRVVTGWREDGDRRTVEMYDTAPGKEMTMSWEEFRRVHDYVLHGDVPTDDSVAAYNTQVAGLYALMAAAALALSALGKGGLSRARRAAAVRTLRRADELGVLDEGDRARAVALGVAFTRDVSEAAAPLRHSFGTR